MGIEMEYSLETPLDVLSRAALMVQNEEREAALKRNGDPPNGLQIQDGGDYDAPCKRMRESPPAPPPYSAYSFNLPKSSSWTEMHTSKQAARNGVGGSLSHSSSFSQSSSAAKHTNSQREQPNSEHRESSQAKFETSYITKQQPWQPFANGAAPPAYDRVFPENRSETERRASPPHKRETDTIDSNMPLNLSVSNSAARREAMLTTFPRAPEVSNHHNAHALRGVHSASPGVPENVAGRRVMTYNGMVFYPTPMHGASLPNMEAKTYRDVDSDACDPAIEEHFRRSLGSAYTECMSTGSVTSSSWSRGSSPRTPTPPSGGGGSGAGELPSSGSREMRSAAAPAQRLAEPMGDNRIKHIVSVSGTVDEHFAKALGKKTWHQIQKTEEEPTSDCLAVDDHFNKALGADTWHKLKQHMASA